MIIYPAIDLYDGKAVRLFKGDYAQMTVYSDCPPEIAEAFIEAGARRIHTVDLEGAKEGSTPNFDTVLAIKKAADKAAAEADGSCAFVEIGGGIRDEERIKRYLDAGVGRVILGTVAAEDPDFVSDMVSKYKDQIAVGVDARDGRVAVKGWLEVTDIDSVQFCREMREAGVKTIIYTDISKDGAMQGTNMEIYRRLNEIDGLDVMASGGISSIEEVKELSEFTYGAILGKALYDGVLDLAECIRQAGVQ